MKYFAVLLLTISLLAESPFAVNCNTHENVNISLVHDAYLEAVRNVSVPTIERGDNAAKFKEEYAKLALDYLLSLIKLTHHRGQEIGEEFIEAVQKLSNKLAKCCESINNSNSTCLDSNLKNLTKQFVAFLNLIPGNALIKRRALPDLPPQPEAIESQKTDRRPADIFVNLAKTMDNDFSSFFNFTIIINLAGWDAARTQFNILQTQFRDEILNCLILKAYRQAVDKALQLQCGIQSHVDEETWQSFKNACDRIVMISDDFNASKNAENCS